MVVALQFFHKMQNGFTCETGSSAVSETNTRNCNGFRQQRGEILRICWHGGQKEPRPPSQWSSSSQPPSLDFSTSSSEDEGDVRNVTGQHPQPCQWTLPTKPWRHVVHTFIGAPNRKSSEAAHITRESTSLSFLLLFFVEVITWLVMETNHY